TTAASRVSSPSCWSTPSRSCRRLAESNWHEDDGLKHWLFADDAGEVTAAADVVHKANRAGPEGMSAAVGKSNLEAAAKVDCELASGRRVPVHDCPCCHLAHRALSCRQTARPVRVRQRVDELEARGPVLAGKNANQAHYYLLQASRSLMNTAGL